MDFTTNETLGFMYENTAAALKSIADYVEKHRMNWQDVVSLLHEISDEHDAQSIVVRLRDEL